MICKVHKCSLHCLCVRLVLYPPVHNNIVFDLSLKVNDRKSLPEILNVSGAVKGGNPFY